MKLTASTVAALGVFLATASSAAAQDSAPYRVYRPDGAGPHPAVAVLGGCSGLAPSMSPKFYERAAEQLRSQGYLVIFVDYLGRRNLQTCARAPINHSDVGKDLAAATAWLRTRPDVDKAQITAIGWSYGGGGVLAALAEHTEEQLGLTRAVVYYPDCRTVRAWKSPTPVLMLIAAEDTVAPGKPCQQTVPKNTTPAATKIVVYPDAFHGFDVSELPAKTTYAFGTIGYQAKAATAAWEEVQQFLKATPPR